MNVQQDKSWLYSELQRLKQYLLLRKLVKDKVRTHFLRKARSFSVAKEEVNQYSPVNTGLFSHVLFFSSNMSITYDFQIIGSGIPGLSLVVAQNEDAFSYLTEEVDMTILRDGSAPLASDLVGDFINDAEWAHLCSQLV